LEGTKRKSSGGHSNQNSKKEELRSNSNTKLDDLMLTQMKKLFTIIPFHP